MFLRGLALTNTCVSQLACLSIQESFSPAPGLASLEVMTTSDCAVGEGGFTFVVDTDLDGTVETFPSVYTDEVVSITNIPCGTSVSFLLSHGSQCVQGTFGSNIDGLDVGCLPTTNCGSNPEQISCCEWTVTVPCPPPPTAAPLTSGGDGDEDKSSSSSLSSD